MANNFMTKRQVWRRLYIKTALFVMENEDIKNSKKFTLMLEKHLSKKGFWHCLAEYFTHE